MSALRRFASVSVASAAVIGMIVPVEVAPPATAAPCAQTTPAPGASGVAPMIPVPRSVDHLPIGRKPLGADDRAPLPRLGLLPGEPGSITSAPLEDQGAVIPWPSPPGMGNQSVPNGIQQNPNTAPAPAAAVPAPTTSIAGWVNGPGSPNNTFQRFGMSGADLGILWDNGNPSNDQVLMAFGDTYGDCSVPGQQWRRNTMFRSPDRNLGDGITVPDGVVGDPSSGSPEDQPSFSKENIGSLNLAASEPSVIPTAGISVGATQLINFMSVKQWGNPGRWTTNFSAIATSTDNGQNWSVDLATIRAAGLGRVPGVRFVSGNQNFQQGAFMRPGDGYVYSFGTPSGRGGAAHLARVPENSVLDLSQYEYWNKGYFGSAGSWVLNRPSAATAVIPAPVSEMSAQYNAYLQKYVVLYCNGVNNVVMRTASAPQGPWSAPQVLVRSTQVPGGIYAPFVHPWSSGRDLYFNLSLWSSYNVMLMHTVLP
ncbi:MAG: DUF4185 domain-containing protein [Mycobacterium sp.]